MADREILTIEDITSEMDRLLSEDKVDEVTQFLGENQFSVDLLKPYLHYSDKHYTRNLIYKSELFEMLALCWRVGDVSWIHNHQSEYCWMAVVDGRLAVQNFARLGCDQKQRTVELEETDEVILEPGNGCQVDPGEPIHLVANPERFGEPAVSLHIYSKPFEECVVYDLDQGICRQVSLCYTSEYGQLNPPKKGGCCKIENLPLTECTLCPAEVSGHCGGPMVVENERAFSA